MLSLKGLDPWVARLIGLSRNKIHFFEVKILSDIGKNLLLWLVIAAVLLTVFNNFNLSRKPK